MSDAHTKAEQLAAEEFPDGACDAETCSCPDSRDVRIQRSCFTTGYLTARTITADEWSLARSAVNEVLSGWVRMEPDEQVDLAVDLARAVFRSVGLRVEGGE